MKKSLKISVLMVLVLGVSSLACQSFLTTAQPQVQGEGPLAVATVEQPVQIIPQVIEQVMPNLVDLEGSLTTLYEKVNPGVVSIQVLTEQGGGQGSGFVIDKEGHIVTNFHVVEGATRVEVDFPSGFKAFGEVLGTDLDSDLAVIKVEAAESELTPIPLGDSDSLRVGQTVVAIGNPFGLSGTMTVGIVSGKSRTLESLRTAPGGNNYTAGDVIQTDAAINPGNSGGPLLNLDGEVIGVNRAIRTGNFTTEGEPTNSGIGFAVSVNIVKRVVPSLIESGTYDYPYLGVSALPEISLLAQEEFNLPRTSGVYVTEVVPDGPSATGGVLVGDLITQVDGRELRVFADLIGYLFTNKSPGETVTFTILRNGAEQEVEVVLGQRP